MLDRIRLLLLFVVLMLPSAVAAQSGPIEVQQVWSRAAPQGHTGALYLTVTDKGAADRLIGVETPVADRAELHESKMENGVMTMRPVDSLPVAPGKPLTLKPGGLHVMLMGLNRNLNEGDRFPVTLRFANAGTIEATAMVSKAGAPMAHGEPVMSHDHGSMGH